MAGDLELYDQQKKPSATLVAGTGGAVPTRGDALEIVGEGASGPQVGALSGTGNFIGLLTELPVDYDEDATFADGDVIGEVTLEVPHPIHWFEAGATPPAAGDSVVVDTDGVRTFDPVDAGADDQPEMIVGKCWRTTQTDEGTTDRVAVVRQKL